MSELNSITALAGLLGKDAKDVQIAEEKGELNNLITEFNNSNKVFSLNEVADLKRNTELSYLNNIVNSDNDIPPNLYNKVKGTVLEQYERKLKRNFDYSGDYENFDSLVENIITSQSKQPNESKKEDLEKIAELEGRLNEYGKTVQQNEQFRNQIMQFEETLNQKTNEITNKYQSKILNENLSRLVNKIPFNDNDNEFTNTLLKDGFTQKLQQNIEFKFDDNDNIVAFDKNNNTLITDKVGNALALNQVIEQQVKTFNVPLKEVKQGDNIHSTSYNANSLNSKEDAKKHIEKKGIQGLAQQVEVFASVNKK